MAYIPKIIECEALQCKKPRVQGSAFCIEHGGKPKLTQKRRESNAPYKTTLWETIRARQLSIEPTCQACALENRVIGANHVDHVFPWHAIGAQSFTINLFQSLCAPHHSYKTGLEQKGIFRYYTRPNYLDLSINDYGYYMQTMQTQAQSAQFIY